MAFIQNEKQVFTDNRAGLRPKHVNISETYNITTEDVGNFLINKIVEMANRLNSSIEDSDTKAIKDLKNSLNSKDIEFAKNFNASFLTFSFSKNNKFTPIMIYMPLSVARNFSFNNNENTIFQRTDNNKNIIINPIVYTVLSMYTYSANDVNAICSHEGNRIYHLSPSGQDVLRKYSKLRIIPLNRGRSNQVGIWIDPIRVFHDMLSDPNPENNTKGFRVEIKKDNIKQISGQNYNYSVIKTPNGKTKKSKNRKNDKNFDMQICEALRRG